MNKIIFFLALLITGFFNASAQSNSSANHTITLILQNSFNTIIGFGLDTTETSVNSIDFKNSLAKTDFKVKSKQPWAISINPIAENFTVSDVDADQGFENNYTVSRMSVVYTASQE